jgi:hypothetical protein
MTAPQSSATPIILRMTSDARCASMTNPLKVIPSDHGEQHIDQLLHLA